LEFNFFHDILYIFFKLYFFSLIFFGLIFFYKKNKFIKTENSKLLFLFIAFNFLFFISIAVSLVRVKNFDYDLRKQLEFHAVGVADALNVERFDALSFTKEDLKNPIFTRMKNQLVEYGRFTGHSLIYTMILKNNNIYFGPENYEHNQNMASFPGTIYENPPRELYKVFEKSETLTIGPFKDEYGIFVSAFAPVFDIKKNKVKSVVGVDIIADNWKEEILKSIDIPYFFLIIITFSGFLFYLITELRDNGSIEGKYRKRHIETAFICIILSLITFYLSILVYFNDSRKRAAVFEKISYSNSNLLRQEFLSIRKNMNTVAAVLSRIENIKNIDINSFISNSIEQSAVEEYFWVENSELEAEDFNNSFLKKLVSKTNKSGLITAEFNQSDSKLWVLTPCFYENSGKVKGYFGANVFINKICLKSIKNCIINKDGIYSSIIDLHEYDWNGYLNNLSFLNPFKMEKYYPVFIFGKTYALLIKAGNDFYLSNPLRSFISVLFAGVFFTFTATLIVGIHRNRYFEYEKKIEGSFNALIESEERFKSMANLIPAIIFEMNIDGQLTFVNKYGYEMSGYDKNDVEKGFKGIDFIIPEQHEKAIENIMKTLAREELGSIEYIARKKNGDEFYVLSQAIPIINNKNEVTGLRGIFLDITDQKNAEQESLEIERRFFHSQKLESLGVLAGGIAHDFNNLLSVILGNLEVVLKEIDKESVMFKVQNSISAVRQAKDLTRQMLAYSGKGHFVIRYINVNKMIENNLEILKSIASKKAEIIFRLNHQIPFVKADLGQIHQIVLNLITNAAEAIVDRGNIIVSTGIMYCDEEFISKSLIESKPEPGNFVWIEVQDNGKGMDENTVEKIFEPFFTTKFTGRGIGMAAVHGIVRGHNGIITIETEINKGTIIKVLLPAVYKKISSTSKTIDKKEKKSLKSLKKFNILIVDDEEMVRDVCEEMLNFMGFSTIKASGGREAVEIFTENHQKIDCILLDLTMPDMNGIETFKELKKILPEIKIILFSGFDESELGKKYDNIEPDGFIQKPFEMDELKDIIENILS